VMRSVVRPHPEQENVTVGGCGGMNRITWLRSGWFEVPAVNTGMKLLTFTG